MSIIVVGSTTTLAAGDHVQMHNTYAIDANVPTTAIIYVAGTTGWVGINTVVAGTQPAGVLDIVAGTSGIAPAAFLPPRMNTTNKNAISPTQPGMVVFDTTLNKLCFYTSGSSWQTCVTQ